MPSIKYEKRQKIITQAIVEISFDRRYKQGKIKNWQINEELYYGKKQPSQDARANIDLGRMQEFVHGILSKIDNPLIFKFKKLKDAQLKRVKRLNALRVLDSQTDDWDIKDIVGKKQAIIYGRAVYFYSADSHNGYRAHLDPCDVYDFLIDPSAGGIDVERARHLGRYGVVKSRQDIVAGIKSKMYLKTEGEVLLEGSGNSTNTNQEELNKRGRTGSQSTWKTNKEIDDNDKFVFWEWYTTYEGVRYYLLFNEDGATAIRVEELTEVFESNLWPIWTYACFPDLTEFWTPSFCDYVREIFMTQALSINQAVDNSEEINKPQKIVDVGAVQDLAQLKYRRGGNYITLKSGSDASRAIQFSRPPSINTPLAVFDKLEQIQEKASGLTAGSKGVSDDDKVGIYEGNQENAADRFGYLNKAYAFGYKRFAMLYEHGVREHLTKKVSIEILGPNGVETEEVSRRDIFRKNEKIGVIIEASNAEIALSESEKRTKLTFLGANAQNPVQNPKKAYELQATIAGFDEDTIRQLQDTSEFANAELMSEAERDIESLLDGKDIKPNRKANAAYKQRFVDFMMDHEEDIGIGSETATKFFDYIDALEPIIMSNMARTVNQLALDGIKKGMGGAGAPAEEILPEEQPNPDLSLMTQ